MTLEQELVRAEAQSLVADAQLTNVTRQKFKEAYDVHTAAIIERAEKQILLAQQARRLVSLLDDTPTVPGEDRPAYLHAETGREILNDAEAALRGWHSSVEPIPSSAGSLGTNAMATHTIPDRTEHHASDAQRVEAMERAQEEELQQEQPQQHPQESLASATSSSEQPPYPPAVPTAQTTTATTTEPAVLTS